MRVRKRDNRFVEKVESVSGADSTIEKKYSLPPKGFSSTRTVTDDDHRKGIFQLKES
jgi:hypothetical protein